MTSSRITVSPAAPKCLSTSMLRAASLASSTVDATTTPLPAQSPSALTTIGAPRRLISASASAYVLTIA